MKDSDFDNYIKSLGEEELTPPAELQWEFMDIPIPKKRNKKKFIFLFLILVLGGLSSMFFLIGNEEEEMMSTLIETSSIDENISENNSMENNDISNSEVEILDDKTAVTKQAIINNNIVVTTDNELKEVNVGNKNKKQFIDNVSVGNVISKEKEVTQSNTKLLLSNEEGTVVPLIENEKIEEVLNKDFALNEKEDISKEINAEDLNAIQPNLIKGLKYNFKQQDLEYSIPKWRGKFNLSLGYGFNISKNRYSSGPQASLMNDAESSSYGNSYNMDLGFKINNSILFNGGLSYHRLHTTFYFEEDLGFEDDFTTFTRTYSTRKVFHNNYSEYLDLNVGIGTRISLFARMNIDVFLNLNPGMRMSAKGRILNDDSEVVYIEDNPSKNNLMLSAGTSARLSYNLKGMNIYGGFEYSRGLTKLKLIEDSNLSIKPQRLVFSLGLSKRF